MLHNRPELSEAVRSFLKSYVLYMNKFPLDGLSPLPNESVQKHDRIYLDLLGKEIKNITAEDADTNTKKGMQVLLFMLVWFAVQLVLFAAVCTTFYAQHNIGSYRVVYTAHGESLWTDSPEGKDYPVGVIATILIIAGTFCPFVFFATLYGRYTAPQSYHPVDFIVPAYYYTVFWIGTALSQAGMYMLAAPAAGVCELWITLCGGVTCFAALFVLSRVQFADAWVHHLLAFVLAIPLPVTLTVNMSTEPSQISQLDKVAVSLFMVQYAFVFLVLMILSASPATAYYIHADFYLIIRKSNDEAARQFFFKLLKRDDLTGTPDPVPAESIPEFKTLGRTGSVSKSVLQGVLKQREHVAKAVIRKALESSSSIRDKEILLLWLHPSDVVHNAKIGKGLLILSAVLFAFCLGAVLYALLASSVSVQMAVTRSMCEKVVSHRLIDGAVIFFSVLFGLPALVSLLVAVVPSARDYAAEQVRAHVPISWRFFAGGFAMGAASGALCGVLGITDLHVLVVLCTLSVLGGFLQLRMRRPFDIGIQVVAVVATLLPSMCLVTTAHVASVSSSRLLLCYLHLAVNLVLLTSTWVHACSVQSYIVKRGCCSSVYLPIEYMVCACLLVFATILVCMILSLELFRY